MIEKIMPLSEEVEYLRKRDPVMARCIMAVSLYQKINGISTKEAEHLLYKRITKKNNIKIEREIKARKMSRQEWDEQAAEIEKLFREETTRAGRRINRRAR